MPTKSFGEYFKDLRIKKGISLREFCVKYNLDPGNMSKIERGILPPPQDVAKLKELASHLDIKEGSDTWHTFIDLASAETGRVPHDIANDAELAKRLPVLFRTLRRKRITREDLEGLIEKLRQA